MDSVPSCPCILEGEVMRIIYQCAQEDSWRIIVLLNTRALPNVKIMGSAPCEVVVGDYVKAQCVDVEFSQRGLQYTASVVDVSFPRTPPPSGSA